MKKSIISDIIQKQLPVAQEGFETLQEESQRMNSMLIDQEHELRKISKKINDARINLRGRITRYFEDLVFQSKGVSLETFNEFLHREIGTEGSLINQRVQEIFSDEVSSIAQDLDRIQTKIDSEFTQFHNIVVSMGKKGLGFLKKSNAFNSQNVLLVRDGIQTASKALGMDLGGMLKFKPWGATKLANGIGSALAVLGLALELWDSWKQEQQKLKFQQAMLSIQDNLSSQRQEIISLIDGQNFIEDFFPAHQKLNKQLCNLQNELDQISKKYERFKEWYSFGQAIDVEFREVGEIRQPLTLPTTSTQSFKPLETPARESSARSETPTFVPEVSNRDVPVTQQEKTVPKSLWKRFFS